MDDKLLNLGVGGIVVFLVIVLWRTVNPSKRNDHEQRERTAGEKSPEYWENRNREIIREEVQRAMQSIHERLIDIRREIDSVRGWQMAQDWREGDRERRR